ncbi:hypothetical protein BLNAU_22071 [Blattamonas nauphoetae]|uniref:Uncharacterized protein n=1 Tax=Blattamonas nauphoetae TaxID=2049346 RepID=A0ABQ9WU41_9EUKA|nr:hypothetical protein BLNAU_22071 [Blattamonas nauphoetae]
MSENRSKQLTLMQYSIYQEKKRSDKTKEQVAMIHVDELTSFNQSELSDNQELVNDIGKEDEPKETRNETLTPAERARHLYPTWVNRPECIGPDNASCFSLSDGGIICRICSFSQNDIPKTRDHYISLKANPTSSNSVLGHVQSETHKEAVARWIKQHSVLPVQLPVEDTKSLNQHKINQVKAVNFIAHERNACSQFNSTTDLLNSVNNPHFVGRTKISDMALFWSIADSIDLFYLKKVKGEITDRTPLAVVLDTSTDRTSTTVLCVNLKYVHTSRLETVLVGLEEMTAGSTGVQL